MVPPGAAINQRSKTYAWREAIELVMVLVCGQTELPQVVAAVRTVGGLTRALHRGKDQADQDGDDRDHNQKLDECEPAPRGSF
jgi:hypothetical protein